MMSEIRGKLNLINRFFREHFFMPIVSEFLTNLKILTVSKLKSPPMFTISIVNRATRIQTLFRNVVGISLVNFPNVVNVKEPQTDKQKER